MSLLLLGDVKTYLRIESNVEDALVQRLLDDALALLEGFLRRSILTASVAYAGTRADAYPAARAVRSHNGSATYGASTSNATALESLPDYATRIERIINSALMDMVADKYYNRNPNRSSESGSGMSIAYNPDGIPKRVAVALGPYRAR